MAKIIQITVTDELHTPYPLLEGELIVGIMFEPQGVHNSGIQPSHQYHGCNYKGRPGQKKNFGYPFFNLRNTGFVLYVQVQELWYVDYQCEDPRTRNDHLKQRSVKRLMH